MIKRQLRLAIWLLILTGLPFGQQQAVLAGADDLSGISKGSVIPPYIIATYSRLLFSATADSPQTQSVFIAGEYLEGDISLTLGGQDQEMFSVNKSGIPVPASGVISYASIEITYSPTRAGIHTAELILSSPGAVDKIISLEGKEASDTPFVQASCSTVSFDEMLIQASTSQVITVSGNYLSEPISLSLSGEYKDLFSIDKTSLSPQDGQVNQEPITITYSPTEAGTHTATLTLSSPGAGEQVISLSGQAILPPSGCEKIIGNGIQLRLRGKELWIENTGEATLLSVYSLSGRSVMTGELPTGTNSLTLPAGVYIVRAGSTAQKIRVR